MSLTADVMFWQVQAWCLVSILEHPEYLVRKWLSNFFHAGEIENDRFEFFKPKN